MDLSAETGEETRTLLGDFYRSVLTAVEQAVKAVRDNDQQAAESVVLMMIQNIWH